MNSLSSSNAALIVSVVMAFVFQDITVAADKDCCPGPCCAPAPMPKTQQLDVQHPMLNTPGAPVSGTGNAEFRKETTDKDISVDESKKGNNDGEQDTK